MALFERKADRENELVAGTDAATRALSTTPVENDFVEGVYDKLAKVYDLFFGPTLHPGRLRAIQRMGMTGQDRVLEVGVVDAPHERAQPSRRGVQVGSGAHAVHRATAGSRAAGLALHAPLSAVDDGDVHVRVVLLELVETGMSREDAYALVQAAAMETWNSGTPFRETLRLAAEREGKQLDEQRLDAVCDPQRYVERLAPTFDQLAALA